MVMVMVMGDDMKGKGTMYESAESAERRDGKKKLK